MGYMTATAHAFDQWEPEAAEIVRSSHLTYRFRNLDGTYRVECVSCGPLSDSCDYLGRAIVMQSVHTASKGR